MRSIDVQMAGCEEPTPGLNSRVRQADEVFDLVSERLDVIGCRSQIQNVHVLHRCFLFGGQPSFCDDDATTPPAYP